MDNTLENVKAVLRFFSVCGTPDEREFCSGLLDGIAKDEEKEVDKMYDFFKKGGK